MTKKYDVYIIYRRKDRDTARIIAQLLKSAGKSVFYDLEVLLAGDLSKQISTGLESSQSYMVLLSEGCANRSIHPGDWWTKEVEHAVQSGKRIIPVNINDSFKSDELKDMPEAVMSLLKIHWMPFYLNKASIFVKEILSLLDNQVSNERKKEKCDIFLAYPRKDLKAAEKLCKVIKDNGLSVWRDIDGVCTGDSYVDVIINAIYSSKVFIAIYSSWALNSQCFNYELKIAQEKKIPIIKVLTDTPEGLSGTRRMTFGSLLEMGSPRFEEKLLSSILKNGCKPVTTEMASYGKELYDEAIRTSNMQKESRSFSILLRAAELGDREASSYIESRLWNIDLRDAVSQYIPINSYFIEDLRADLYNRGEIIAEDPTLNDSSVRGEGMERAAFKMMKRAIDLGFDGSNPTHYSWCYLTEDDFEECLNLLGESSRFLLNRNEDKLEKQLVNTAKISPSKTYDIFISYRRKDSSGNIAGRDIARGFKHYLETKGYKCFFDYSNCDDGEFEDIIIPSIRNSKFFLLIMTNGALDRCVDDWDWVRREITEAFEHNLKIIPVAITDFEHPEISFHGNIPPLPSPLNRIEKIQWSEVSMGSLYEVSVDLMIEKRIKKEQKHEDKIL